jgi:very-short-patch-repair endonuclease
MSRTTHPRGHSLKATTEAQRIIRREQAKALENTLAGQLRYRQCPEPVREFRFHLLRRWRFDFAWPDNGKLAVEVEGGTWTGGRHVTGAGYERDAEKYLAAAALGWRVVRITAKQVNSEEAANLISEMLA